ncbi:MAG: SMI1/KNR4 family protein [Verrucomicrobiota bacterium]
MYKALFEAASKHLRTNGIEPLLIEGEPISEARLLDAERKIGRPIPQDLRTFFLEMGDGFQFIPDREKENLFFMVSWLEDIVDNADFPKILQEEAEDTGGNPSDLVAAELKRRQNWLPIYNIGGGGYMFCLDLEESPSPVRYYERCYWPSDAPETWTFKLADSFHDFVLQWSRYCFEEANGATLINIAMGLTGKFDWAPTRFNPIYDRGKTDV